jgi:hypothetical protein
LNKEAVSNILRNVRENEGFHFYLAIGEPTGMTAVSLKEFVEQLDTVELQSVNFHYARKDFQKWISEVLGGRRVSSETEKDRQNTSGYMGRSSQK